MGTSGSMLIVQDGKVKGCYNHFDSYPGGLGQEVIDALKRIDKSKTKGWEVFKENCKKVKLVGESKKPSKELQERYLKFSNTGVGSQSMEDWYCLLREVQGSGYITAIQNGEIEHMLDGSNFIKESLFCEYAYLIDLDKMTLDFYRGFQQKPQKGNRFGVKKLKGEEFYPCAKVGSIELVGISKNKAVKTMNKLYKDFAETQLD